MNRDEFFQQALLRMADTVLMRATEVPTPEQLARKAREYAQAMTDEMLAGLMHLDMVQETQAPRPRPKNDGPPTLQPVKRASKSSTYDDPDEESPPCPTCGCNMKRRSGKFGEFWGCLDYPNCKGVVNIRS